MIIIISSSINFLQVKVDVQKRALRFRDFFDIRYASFIQYMFSFIVTYCCSKLK